MSEATLSPSNIVKLLRFRWVPNSKRSASQTTFKGSSEFEPQTEKGETSTETGSHHSHQKENAEVATLTHLDTLTELDSTHVKCSKGILKDPKNSIVLKVKSKCGTMANIDSTVQSPQNIGSLTESKIKKVTFSAGTKRAEVRRNLRSVRITKRIQPQNNNLGDHQKVETSPANWFTPMAGFENYSSPRNVFKIKPPKSDKNPRCAFNVNIPLKQSDFEDNKKYLLKIPSFEKDSDFEGPVRAFPSLHTMLEDSPIYLGANSSDATKVVPQSARNTTTKSPWNVQFQDRETSGTLTPRDGQMKPKSRENYDYFGELEKKAPLVLPRKPSRPNSKAGSSRPGSQENIFVISRRDFNHPIMNPSERLEKRRDKAFA